MKDKRHIKSFNEHQENLNSETLDKSSSISDVSDSHYSSNPKDHNKTFETWDELFEFQAKKDGANYTMLKEWLKKFCDVPKLKDE